MGERCMQRHWVGKCTGCVAGWEGWLELSQEGAAIRCFCVMSILFCARIKHIHPRGSTGSLELESQESGDRGDPGAASAVP